MNNATEKEIHAAFDVTLVLKGIHAAIEVIGGALLYIVSTENILSMVRFFVGDEIQEDPHDFIANYFLHAAQSFGGGARWFTAFYLLSHGIVNAAIVIALWKEKLWAYPVSIAALSAFAAYQIYLLTFRFSWWLIVFTLLDAVIIFLVWHEYGVLKKRRASA